MYHASQYIALKGHVFFFSVPFSFSVKYRKIYSKGDQPWDFFGGNDAKAEALVLWPPHVKS